MPFRKICAVVKLPKIFGGSPPSVNQETPEKGKTLRRERGKFLHFIPSNLNRPDHCTFKKWSEHLHTKRPELLGCSPLKCSKTAPNNPKTSILTRRGTLEDDPRIIFVKGNGQEPPIAGHPFSYSHKNPLKYGNGSTCQ